MTESANKTCTAFDGHRSIASGKIRDVAKKAKEALDRRDQSSVLIFDDLTGEVVEIDFRGTMSNVLKRLETTAEQSPLAASPPSKDQDAQRGPGRPKLGVISREVTLLPRHWDWLNSQPGGASVALRKLVEEARRVHSGRDRIRHAQEVAYRFMTALAGNLPGFEEASRALFAGDLKRFEPCIASWPEDVRDYALKLSYDAFTNR